MRKFVNLGINRRLSFRGITGARVGWFVPGAPSSLVFVVSSTMWQAGSRVLV